MTSFTLKFRPSRVEGRTGTLYMQVIHRRMARQINMDCPLYPHEWHNGQLQPAASASERRYTLREMQHRLQRNLDRLHRIVHRLEESGGEYTVEQVVNAYHRYDHEESTLGGFARQVGQHLRRIGKIRLSETYASSVNSFMRFRGKQGDIRLDELNAELMKEYEYYLVEECGLHPNTSSFYMRNLRALYNRAVEKELVENRFPFRQVYTGIGKTVKRAVPVKTLRKIKALKLAPHSFLARVRDLFLLCFFLRGISFVDLSQLKKSDLQQGYLIYRRQKTGQRIVVKWEPKMQEIVARYCQQGSPYLLPILHPSEVEVRRQYRNALQRMNVGLKEIGRRVGSPVPLTTYCARHSWATVARDMNIPLSVISEAMGHESERTTRIYLHALDAKRIDAANRRVMSVV